MVNDNKSKHYWNGTPIGGIELEHSALVHKQQEQKASFKRFLLVTVKLAVAFAILDQKVVWYKNK